MAVEGYDLVMLGILAVAALLGYFKGIVWQIAWIAGIVVSAFVALKFATPLAPWFGQQAPWNRYLAMLALYAGTSLAVWLLFRLVSGFINAIHLSAFDHQLGLLFGLAKGALLCVVITFFTVTLAPSYRHQIVGSRSGRIVAEAIIRADTYLPPQIHETVEPFIEQFERQFAQPGGGPWEFPGGAGPVVGQPPARPGAGPAPGSGPSIQSLLSGLGSMSAWAGGSQGAGGGSGAGGGAQVGGALPPGSAWFAPPITAEPAARQVGFTSPEPPTPSVRPTNSRYAAPIESSFAPPPPAVLEAPQAFPIGAQSPLPRR